MILLARVYRDEVVKYEHEGASSVRELWRRYASVLIRYLVVRLLDGTIGVLDFERSGMAEDGLFVQGTRWPSYEAAVTSCVMSYDDPPTFTDGPDENVTRVSRSTIFLTHERNKP